MSKEVEDFILELIEEIYQANKESDIEYGSSGDSTEENYRDHMKQLERLKKED